MATAARRTSRSGLRAPRVPRVPRVPSRTVRRILVALVGVLALAIGISAPASASATPPGPTNLRATDVGAGSIALAWDPAPDAYSYQVEMRLPGQTYSDPLGYPVASTTATTATVHAPSIGKPIAPETTYEFTVVAFVCLPGSCDDAEPSNTISVTTRADTTAPAAPTGPTARPRSTTSAELRWTDAIDDVGIDHYVIAEGSRTWTTRYAAPGETVTDLATDQPHTLTVRAVDAAGNVSGPSDPVTVRPESEPPSAPANLRVVGDQLVWDASVDNSGIIDHYVVVVPDCDCYDFPDGMLVSTRDASSPLQIFDINGSMEMVPSAGSHTYVVRAYDQSGNMAHSEPLVVDVPDTPPPF